MKRIHLLFLFLPLTLSAQELKSWHLLDPAKDSVLGISSYKAYDFLKGKKADTVIVAVIDNGVELIHEDLQGVIWTNRKEIAGNGIDDDRNGYTDDIHGWNFLGNADGRNLKLETTELTRYYGYLKEKFGDKMESAIPAEQLEEYKTYRHLKTEFQKEEKNNGVKIAMSEEFLGYFNKADSALNRHFGKTDYTRDDVLGINEATADAAVLWAKNVMLRMYEYNFSRESLQNSLHALKKNYDTRLNPDFKGRKEIVGDNPHDLSDSIYGNNIVQAEGPSHGTGVAGIIAALNNGIGVDGVARHVKLMILRVVPNGDEQDKDVALAIRYAVRNGASIVNCSFGKKYSMHPEFVELAVREAEAAGILIVKASGNDADDNDQVPTYPTGAYRNRRANNVLSVGASASADNENMVGYFSNYGKKTVDVYAPGVDVENCALGSGYTTGSGTSVASPVVAGMAAVLKSYYPHLTAKQLKEIITRSVYVPRTKKIVLPGQTEARVKFKDISVSGGIANLYKAVMLVEKKYVKH